MKNLAAVKERVIRECLLLPLLSNHLTLISGDMEMARMRETYQQLEAAVSQYKERLLTLMAPRPPT